MLDIIDGTIGFAAVTVSFVALLGTLALSLAQRLGLAAVLGGWTGLAVALGAAGELVYSPDQPAPLVGILFATPLVLTAATAALFPKVRRALLGMPMPLLIGLNAWRIFGASFLVLAAVGRLSGPFPYSAGLGDIATGVIAVVLARALVKGKAVSRTAIARWNLFGTLDLVAAVGLGLTSANGSPIQLLHVGVGSEAMQHLPSALVPTVLVPFYLILHAIVAAKLRVGLQTNDVTMAHPNRTSAMA
jgi:hypothetical protein